eukprot:226178-Prymnesium_polylepis.1
MSSGGDAGGDGSAAQLSVLTSDILVRRGRNVLRFSAIDERRARTKSTSICWTVSRHSRKYMVTDSPPIDWFNDASTASCTSVLRCAWPMLELVILCARQNRKSRNTVAGREIIAPRNPTTNRRGLSIADFAFSMESSTTLKPPRALQSVAGTSMTPFEKTHVISQVALKKRLDTRNLKHRITQRMVTFCAPVC